MRKQYSGAVTWAEIGGRTKLMIKGRLTDTIRNPTYEVVPTPESWSNYYKGINPEGLADPAAYSADLEAEEISREVIARVMGGQPARGAYASARCELTRFEAAGDDAAIEGATRARLKICTCRINACERGRRASCRAERPS